MFLKSKQYLSLLLSMILTLQLQIKLFHTEHGQSLQVELPAVCNNWGTADVNSVGRELRKLFQNSPLNLNEHNANLQEVMMNAALRSTFPHTKLHVADLNVSMNEDLSCTVNSHVKVINPDDCTVVTQPFSVTSSIDTKHINLSPFEDMLIEPHIKRHYIDTPRYLSLTSEEFAAFLLNPERQALDIARAIQEQMLGKVYRVDLVELYIRYLIACYKHESIPRRCCAIKRDWRPI